MTMATMIHNAVTLSGTLRDATVHKAGINILITVNCGASFLVNKNSITVKENNNEAATYWAELFDALAPYTNTEIIRLMNYISPKITWSSTDTIVSVLTQYMVLSSFDSSENIQIIKQDVIIFEYDEHLDTFKRTTDDKLIKAAETYIKSSTQAVYAMNDVFGIKQLDVYFAYDPFNGVIHKVNSEEQLIGAMKVLQTV